MWRGPPRFSPMLIKIAGGDPLVYTFFYKKCKGGGLRNPRPQDVSTMIEGVSMAIEEVANKIPHRLKEC